MPRRKTSPTFSGMRSDVSAVGDASGMAGGLMMDLSSPAGKGPETARVSEIEEIVR